MAIYYLINCRTNKVRSVILAVRTVHKHLTFGHTADSPHLLRGPAAILFISRDACSDSIAKLFHACFCGGIAQLPRDTLQNGVSHRCVCVKLSTKGGGASHHFGGVLTSLQKYRVIWGVAAIVSQYRAIWAH